MDEMQFDGMTPAQLSEAVFHFQAAKEVAEANMEAAKRELRKRLEHGAYRYGRLAVSVKPSKRFDATLAKEVLSATKYKAICDLKPSAKKAAVLLTEAEFEKTRKTFENTISIKYADTEE